MNQAKRFLGHLRIINSLYSTQFSRTQSFHAQVTQFSRFSTSLFKEIGTSTVVLGGIHQNFLFSTQSETNLEKNCSNDWSKEIKDMFVGPNPKLSHENVTYVLMKLIKDPKKASGFFNWAVEENGFHPSSSIYSLMLRIYANKDSLKEFWVTIKEMKDKGFYIDEETYLSISAIFRGLKMVNEVTVLRTFYERMIKENAMEDAVKKVVGVVKKSDWGNDVERKLEEMGISVSENLVLRVLKELRGRGDLLKALSFFKWVGESLDFKHNSVTYNGILRILCREQTVQEFWSMVKEMKTEGYEIDIDTYVKISREFQKSKMLKDAVQLYEHMMDSPFKPLSKECGLLLRGISACKDPDLDLVFRVVKKYENAGFCLVKAEFDGIHRSLTSVGRFDEAEKIMETMRDSGFEPDNITYSQLVFGLCKALRLEEACKVLDAMEAQGCMPDIKTWTILIQGHCNANEVDKALLCFAKMVEKDFQVDADLLDVLVNGFVSQNRTIGACKFLIEMVNKLRLVPWQATYKNLIEKLLRERRLEEAFALLRLMKKQNYPPHAKPFLEYVSKNGSVEDAVEFLNTLSGKQYPSVSAYQHVFQAFFDEGRYHEAKDILFKCPHHIRGHPAISSLFGSSDSTSTLPTSA